MLSLRLLSLLLLLSSQHNRSHQCSNAGQRAKADYAGQGVWNSKAAAEARKYGKVHSPAGSAATSDGTYPPVEEWYADLSPCMN